MDFAFLSDTFLQLLSGVPLTLNLALVSTALGGILAVLLTLMRMSPVRPLGWTAQFYVFVFRGTPLLVQMFVIYYGLGQFRPNLQAIGLWWMFREPYWCAIIALTLNTAAYGSEILRGAIRNVPRGLSEASLALGLTRLQTLRLVILPLALRQALPAYSNEIILIVKGTSLASIITLTEVTGIAQELIAQTYRAMEVFIAAGAIYLLLNFLIVRALELLEVKLTPYRQR